MRRLGALLLGIASSIGSLHSQQSSLTGPIQGYTFDLPTQSFREVMGLPGSATFGPAVITGFDSGSVAPHKNYAIGFQQGSCFLVTGLDSSPVSAGIGGLSGQPDGVTWSGDGSVAIVFSRSGAWLQELSGLPDVPRVSAVVDLSALGGSVSAVVTDQLGRNIAVAIQGANGGVFLSSDSRSFVSALPMVNPAALTFSGDGTNLYVVDGSALQLTVFTIIDYSSQTFPLSSLQNPSAVASGRDSQGHPVVYVADANDQIFQVYDLASQQVAVNLPLSFQPTGIVALGPSSFVVYARSQPTDPLWLFASIPEAAVYFVPAAQSGSGGVN